jgi:hypothetical protein
MIHGVDGLLKLSAAGLINAACVYPTIQEPVCIRPFTAASDFFVPCLGFAIARLHLLERYFAFAPGV